jgi:effector-binding domain-containing protein
MTSNPVSSTSLSRKILYILLGIILLIFVAGLFMPRSFEVAVEQKVNASSNQVYNLTANVMNGDKWLCCMKSPKDTFAYTYSDVRIGRSAEAKWTVDGKQKYMRIDSAIQSQKIVFESNMNGKVINHSLSFTDNKDVKDGALVNWKIQGKKSYPMNAFLPFIKSGYKKFINKSVAMMNDEMKIRKSGIYYQYPIEEQTQNAKHFLTIRNKVPMDKLDVSYAQTMSTIYQKLQAEGITAIGVPSMLVYEYNEGLNQADIAAAVQVITPVAIKDLTIVSYLQKNAALLKYTGLHANKTIAHYGLKEFLNDRNYTWDVPALEEFVSDPLKEKDSKKWQTNIYYYIASKK